MLVGTTGKFAKSLHQTLEGTVVGAMRTARDTAYKFAPPGKVGGSSVRGGGGWRRQTSGRESVKSDLCTSSKGCDHHSMFASGGHLRSPEGILPCFPFFLRSAGLSVALNDPLLGPWERTEMCEAGCKRHASIRHPFGVSCSRASPQLGEGVKAIMAARADS